MCGATGGCRAWEGSAKQRGIVANSSGGRLGVSSGTSECRDNAGFWVVVMRKTHCHWRGSAEEQGTLAKHQDENDVMDEESQRKKEKRRSDPPDCNEEEVELCWQRA